MRSVVLGIVMIASAGCAVMGRSDYGEALCVEGSTCAERKAGEQQREQADHQARAAWQIAWVDGERWDERQLDDLQKAMGPHFKTSVITCYLNHFYEDYTPKSLMAAVAETDAGLGLQVPTGTPALAANLSDIRSRRGQFIVSISDACRREACAAIEERRREVEAKGLVFMDASGGCDDR
jgi:hypothetical protein